MRQERLTTFCSPETWITIEIDGCSEVPDERTSANYFVLLVRAITPCLHGQAGDLGAPSGGGSMSDEWM